jgi:hypothetical protein
MLKIHNAIQHASIGRHGSSSFAPTHAEQVAALNDGNYFLPGDFIQFTLVPCILILSIIYAMSFRFVGKLVQDDATFQKKRKVCYQMTNLLVNSVLGGLGLYYEYCCTPADVPTEEKISGFENFYLLSCIQLGFQIWSIPVGILYVKESPIMLMHHATVIMVAGMASFLTNGFRYWIPYFFGIMEISSIPLAIMNTFKDNPKWIEKQPLAYLATRVIFSVSFLFIRVWMLVPRNTTYLRDHYLLWSTSDNETFRNFMSAVWISSAFLMMLQFYWAILIVQGILKILLPKKRKVDTGKKNA